MPLPLRTVNFDISQFTGAEFGLGETFLVIKPTLSTTVDGEIVPAVEARFAPTGTGTGTFQAVPGQLGAPEFDYTATLMRRTDGGISPYEALDLGRFRVPTGAGPFVLGALIANGVPPAATSYWRSITQAEFDAVIAAVQAAAAAAAADRAQTGLDRAATELARSEAELYDGPKVDFDADLAAITPAQLPVGGLIRVIETGGVFRRVLSGGDRDFSGIGGVRLEVKVAPTYRLQDFGAVCDGVADDGAALLRALTRAAGAPVICPNNANIRLVNPVTYPGSIDLDLNGSRIIAPNHALRIQRRRQNYDTASDIVFWFVTVAGAKDFLIPADWDLQVGDYIQMRSPTIYEAAGSNRYGYIGTITGIVGGVATVSHPFSDGFGVNRVEVYDGITGKIHNGTFDESGFLPPDGALDAAVGHECVLFRGAQFSGENLTFMGDSQGAIGLFAEAAILRLKMCYGHGFANVQGFGPGGRLGYGLLVHGQDVVLDQCGGSNCKHILMTGSRVFVGGRVVIKNPVCWVNPDDWNVTVAPPAGTQAIWGSLIDSHAGVDTIIIVDPLLTGGNTLINLRNRNAKVIRPVMHHYGSRAASPTDRFVIAAYEGPVVLHEVIDPVLHVYEPSDLTGATLPFLYGLVVYTDEAHHGDVVIRNPRFMSGGGIFGTWIRSDPDYSDRSTLNLVEITGISGRITDGVIITPHSQSGSNLALWARINSIIVDFRRAEAVSTYGRTNGKALRLTDVRDVRDLVRLTGQIDLIPAMTTTDIGAEIGELGDLNMLLPDVIDLKGLKMTTPRGGVYIRTADSTRPIRRIALDDAEISHALSETGANSSHGVTIDLGVLPTTRATFVGSRILKRGSTASNANAINSTGETIDTRNLVVEGGLPNFFNRYWHGLRHIAADAGTQVQIITFGGQTFTTDGFGIFTDTNPPTLNGFPAGTRVRRLATSGPVEWEWTGSSWVEIHVL